MLIFLSYILDVTFTYFNKKYFIYCNGGVKSRKAVNVLEFYGYDVTLVYKNN